MTPRAPAYPPPLSDAPTVTTLRDLLAALQAGTYQVPPVPPLPVPSVPALGPVRAAMESVVTSCWHVEHVGTGVPVSLAIGDRLDVRDLARLRDELGAVRPPPRGPSAPADPVQAPGATWSASDLDRRDLHLLVALAAALACVVAVVAATALL